MPAQVPASAVNRGQTLLNNKYEKLESVGHGAYGHVYKGRDCTTGELVAIKEVKLTGSSQEHLQDVMSEIDLLKSLNHEHIVKYLDSFKSRTHLYIILEFMENGDLSSALKPNKFGVFPEPLAAVYIAQVLQGLVYLHEQGVVHRDIKGANILTTSEGLVKLADFGVATNMEGGAGVQDVVGTPYWMAPEVIEMTEVTAASDVWSVGCLVVELLTGHPPYYELQPMSALFRIVQDVHPPLPEGISPQMEDFLLKCFQKEARQRADAHTLLGHPWVRTNTKQSIRATWGRTQGQRARGGRVHANVSSVMNLFLQNETDGDAEDDEVGEDDVQASVWPPHLPMDGLIPSPGRTGSGHLESATQPHQRTRSAASLSVDSGLGSVVVNPMISARNFHRGNFASSVGRSRVAAEERPMDADGSQSRTGGAVSDSPPFFRQRHSTVQNSENADPSSPRKREVMQMLSEARADGSGAQMDLLSWALSGGVDVGNANSTNTPLANRQLTQVAGMEAWEQSPKLSNMSPTPPTRFGVVDGDRDKLAEKRRESNKIKQLVSLLLLEPGVSKESEVLDACQKLVMLLPESQERKAFFLESSGPVAVLELLNSSSTKTVQAALELVNAISSKDIVVLEALSLVGMVPAVMKIADSSSSSHVHVREQAALFVHQMCVAAPQMQQMLIACSGLPVLVRLIEIDYKTHRALVYRGVSCIWHILEANGPNGRLNDFCRMLAHQGLIERLVHALSSAALECRNASVPLAAANSPSASVSSQPTGMAASSPRVDYLDHSNHADRVVSHSRASSSDRISVSLSRVRGSRPATSVGSIGSDVEAGPNFQDSQVAHDATALVDKTANLLLVFSIADSVVKKHLCRRDTINQLFDTMLNLEPSIALKVLRSVKHLTMDEKMLGMLQGPEIIRRLVMLLDCQVMGSAGLGSPGSITAVMPTGSPGPFALGAPKLPSSGEEHQLEVVHALYNLCRINKQCQERAAVEGAVRSLCKLSDQKSDSNPKLRTLAISMLCRLAHASSASRAQLWQANALAIFLRLTSEPRWQAPAMDAIATWLAEDLVRIEPKLLQTDSLQSLISVFEAWKKQLDTGAGAGELKGLLEIFHRILITSRRLSVALSSQNLPGLAVAMLRKELPMTSLPLLKIVRSLYEAHPRPKEFIIQNGIHRAVQGLAEGEKAALVAKQAQNLLDAFQINSIL